MVTPSAQVGFEGIYGHVLVIKLLLNGLEMVLIIFEKGQQGFTLLPTFTLSAKYQFQTSEAYKTSNNDWQNMFTV